MGVLGYSIWSNKNKKEIEIKDVMKDHQEIKEKSIELKKKYK